jgi:large subunit ribosomal protein L24
MKIHTGDTVVINTGKDKGKQGTVIRILAEKNRVVVEGINMRTRHIKKTAQSAGQRISYEASIHISNVQLIDPKSKKPTRIGYKVDEKGNKVRFARKSGEVIAKAAKAAKAPAKDSKKSPDAGVPAHGDKAAKKPAGEKSPFWKRGGKTAADGASTSSGPDSNVIQTAHRAQGG